MSWVKRGIDKLHDEPVAQRPAATDEQQHARRTAENELFFQAYEWHTRSDAPKPHEAHSNQSHWGRLARILPSLAALGVSALWLPPGCKANSPHGNGYDCYDLWDLGEFDQKWTRSTKWGSREELRHLVDAAAQCGPNGVELVWDAVLSHKTAGDATEETWAVEVDPQDRRVEICAPKKIEAWLTYDFPGRAREGMKYSALKWRADHFNGTDWDQRAQRKAIYKLIDDPASHRPVAASSRLQRLAREVKTALTGPRPPPIRPGKGWHADVDTTFGNYDYLLFSNVYYAHPDVRHDVLRWGRWMVEETGVHGFRLDAAQHFSWSFTREWIANVHAASRQKHGKDAFILAEVLSGQVSRIRAWLDFVTPPGCGHTTARAIDTPLLVTFSHISEAIRNGSRRADLRALLSGPGHPDQAPLVSIRPHQAFTYVTNHDTQTNQSSFVPMDAGLKSLFYAFILLRQHGQPCVFWGDLYGTRGDGKTPAEGPACRAPHAASRCLLPSLMMARKLCAYGAQRDYFDSPSCVGWTRSGTHDRPGCVVLMSIAPPDSRATKRMAAGRPGQRWVDVLSDSAAAARPHVLIDGQGEAAFAVTGRRVAVYVRDGGDAARFPVVFDHDVYRQ